MKRLLKTLFHFLGGLTLALMLLSTVAICVIVGTILESKTDSHLYAADSIYAHPLFFLLLGAFFINILFAALRRWPFKRRHIPFLITHLGLLMVIGGTIAKNWIGTQGSMTVVEGSGSQTLFFPQTYALNIEKRGVSRVKISYPFSLTRTLLQSREPFPELQFAVLGSLPDVKETLESWIKGSYAYITGQPPFPVQTWNNTEKINVHSTMNLHGLDWDLIALRTDKADEAIRQLRVSSKPTLLWIEEPAGDVTMFVLDHYGSQYSELFPTTQLKSLIAYDQGFGGYTVQGNVPLPCSPDEKNTETLAQLSTLLKSAVASNTGLAPPLEKLKQACQEAGSDFTSTFVTILKDWDISGSLLIPFSTNLNPDLIRPLQQLSWDPQDLQACRWISLLFEQLEPRLQHGDDLITYLESQKWPLIEPLKQQQELGTPLSELLTILAQQLFALAPSLPLLDEHASLSSGESAHLFSAFLKTYGLELQALPFAAKEEDPATVAILEAPLTPRHTPETAARKQEECCPVVFLEAHWGTRKQKLSLAYDSSASKLKWPLFGGEYLIRFQPSSIEIPYRIRLRQARQINYTDTMQPYSYESDVIITDAKGQTTEATLSMNRVYETWDGYRFYLGGMSSAGTEGIKRIHLVVNHDPVKYTVTYPGAALVALGMILLFTMWPYRKERNE